MSENFQRGDLSHAPVLLYQTEDGRSKIDVILDGKTAWLTQGQMAELFQTSKQNISMHINNIYQENELQELATVKEYLTVHQEGGREVQRSTKFYNLEVIVSVGYRVRSHRGTQFRRWATERLNEYLVKGFVLDDERLKEGKHLGTDYFDELLERIRDIRASEKRFYQKIRDIYMLSIDYDPDADTAKEFFQIVQNKLHWAIAGMTAAEIIADRADASKPNMGLTSWKGAKVRKGDVTVAKNYLSKDEINSLNRFVVMYLDYAEDQAKRGRPLYMRDWKEKLNAFLRFNEREILDHPGKVSAEVAKALALEEYEKFNQQRLAAEAEAPDPDFDAIVKKLSKRAKRENKDS
jgi:hypothetical protein